MDSFVFNHRDEFLEERVLIDWWRRIPLHYRIIKDLHKDRSVFSVGWVCKSLMLFDAFLHNGDMKRTWSRMACWTSGLVTDGAATDSPNVPSGKDHWNWRSCLICKTWRLINKTRAWLLGSIGCKYQICSKFGNIHVCESVLRLCFRPQSLMGSFRHFQHRCIATKCLLPLNWACNGVEDNAVCTLGGLVLFTFLLLGE